MMPKILIVGTVPYNKRSTSRAFESYFSGYDRTCLAQIFSNTKKPAKGHCQTLYQITDQRLLLCRFKKKQDPGIIYQYDDLELEWEDNSSETDSVFFDTLYRIGSQKTPLIYLLRGLVWKKKYWCTERLNRWLDDFNPDCVFLAFSDDFFIPQIALYVAQKYCIPIVSCIGDDYYFNEHFSVSPFYYLYRTWYKKLIRQVFVNGRYAVYICEKIRDKYNSEFGLHGQTVYLTSDLKRRPFTPISEHPTFAYFGNIGLGRYRSLYEIGQALQQISPDFYLDIYSNQIESRAKKLFDSCTGIRFKGSISYAQVQKEIEKNEIFVIVEGFETADVNAARYSLSTKAADALASGANILVYGSEETGVVSYMIETGAAVVCTDPRELKTCIQKMLMDEEGQRQRYDKAVKITKENHNLCSSTQIFQTVINEAIRDNGTRGL